MLTSGCPEIEGCIRAGCGPHLTGLHVSLCTGQAITCHLPQSQGNIHKELVGRARRSWFILHVGRLVVKAIFWSEEGLARGSVCQMLGGNITGNTVRLDVN